MVSGVLHFVHLYVHHIWLVTILLQHHETGINTEINECNQFQKKYNTFLFRPNMWRLISLIALL